MSRSKYMHLLNASTLLGLEVLFWLVWARLRRQACSIFRQSNVNIPADVDISGGVPRRSRHHPQKIWILVNFFRLFYPYPSFSFIFASRLSYSLITCIVQLHNTMVYDVPASVSPTGNLAWS